ncbi:MAG: hypothetical protein H7099_00210 [Gemmatimonadaceae bacterium]|nr:hypothetical protein [Gemmatimonadaceae bacterium]
MSVVSHVGRVSSLLVVPLLALGAQQPVLTEQNAGTSALFQAVSVSANDPDIVWISGHAGTWARSLNAGATWESHVMPGHDSLQFRDVHAIDANRAWLMAAGTGVKSGIFQTRDGGLSWAQVFANTDTAAFYDCMAFWDDTHGFAFSDAVNSRTPIAYTANGTDWSVFSVPALDGEGGFAASGGCAQTLPSGDAWISTGSAATPRVRHSTDRGRTWTDAILPLASGSGAGATAVAFRDARHGIAVGGVIGGTATGPRAARTIDGGRTWSVITEPSFTGAVYGVAYTTVRGKAVVVAVGPGGAAFSVNDGDTWTLLDSAAYWSVGFGRRGRGWLVGPKGRVVRLDWR